ncbi:MAG: glycosyltransferase family 2 protein [Rhodobacteraceae bacterium]|nr:glycosyltransferase family 2 protein [Paracoccaceae bacterium]
MKPGQRWGQKWGLSATIKAPIAEILKFAAYHLELGAHRLYIYLDDDNPEAFAALKAHPKIRVTQCDDKYWHKTNGKRPKMHQPRQTVNATHAYYRQAEVDWLIHMDVDEFLWPDSDLQQQLNLIDAEVMTARTRPQELLADGGTSYKMFIPPSQDRAAIVGRLYPQYGDFVKGGFLSHLAGKLFVRTGLDNVTVKIHNVLQGTGDGQKTQLKSAEMPGVALCHNHAKTWDTWIAAYRFRHKSGSYRAELGRNRPAEQGGINMHDLFRSIEAEQGADGLRAFFDEVCADTPQLRDRLANEGLLCTCDLQLEAKLAKHFPK